MCEGLESNIVRVIFSFSEFSFSLKNVHLNSWLFSQCEYVALSLSLFLTCMRLQDFYLGETYSICLLLVPECGSASCVGQLDVCSLSLTVSARVSLSGILEPLKSWTAGLSADTTMLLLPLLF